MSRVEQQSFSLSLRTIRLLLACLIIAAAVAGLACNLQLGSLGQPNSGGTGAAGAFGASAPTVADAAERVARDIEEADIVKIDGGKLYALNRFKGLIIVDVSDPDAPVLLGTKDLRGRGVEMYVVGQRVYVILSADFVYATGVGMAVGMAEPDATVSPVIAPGPPVPAPDYEGSQLAIIDVSNPASPLVLDKINLAGFANDSRRVGNIIYVVGANGFPYYYRAESDAQHDEGFVASINVADPNNVIPVERKTFDGTSLAVHVSDTLLLAASQEYDSENGGGTMTRVQAIDISDSAGAIDVRGSVMVPGRIRNRFYLDDFEGVLRIATESDGFGFQDVKLFTYSLADLDDITPLGSVLIKRGESLEAVRFDGPRGYAVTFLRIDPLFVIDLRDPANPAVSGQLEVPGFSTHIEPRGNRLFAVGIDDTNGTRPVLAYYNVEDPANPTQLGRVVLGPPGSYTESEATYDEKAFKIVDEMNLIAIPFRHVDYPADTGPPSGPQAVGGGAGGSAGSEPGGGSSEPVVAVVPSRPTCVNAVQLVDFSDTALTQRGSFEHQGTVERVGAIGQRVFALSQAALQTVNITDRDQPVKAGEVKFFTEAEAVMYDDCGYYYYGLPTDTTGFDFFPLGQLLSRFCGTTGVMPLLVTAVGMFVMRGRRRR